MTTPTGGKQGFLASVRDFMDSVSRDIEEANRVDAGNRRRDPSKRGQDRRRQALAEGMAADPASDRGPGVYSPDWRSGAIVFLEHPVYKLPGLSGDAYRTQRTASPVRPRSGELRQPNGNWREVDYFNLTDRSLLGFGTTEQLATWLADNANTAIALNMELDMWDALDDVDYGTYQITAEVGIAGVPKDWRPKRLAGVTDFYEDLIIRGAAMGGAAASNAVPHGDPVFAARCVDSGVEAIGKVADVGGKLAKRKPRPSEPEPQVFDAASARERLQMEVRIYAGPRDRAAERERPSSLWSTWQEDELQWTRFRKDTGGEAEYAFLFAGHLGTRIRSMLDDYFEQLAVNGWIR